MPDELARVTRHVAVVAVHGVADQKPDDTARDVTRLLVSLPQYGAATEGTQTIRVAPIAAAHRTQAPMETAEFKSAYLQNLPAGKRSLPDDVEFTNILLQDYKLSEQSYTTTVTTVDRAGTVPPISVDIYELYWADLSRLGTTLLRIVSEFYQLLFHLGSLGRLAIDAATVHHQNQWGWKTLQFATAVAAKMLAQPITLLNLALAALALVGVAVMLPEGWHSGLVAGGVGVGQV